MTIAASKRYQKEKVTPSCKFVPDHAPCAQRWHQKSMFSDKHFLESDVKFAAYALCPRPDDDNADAAGGSKYEFYFSF